MKLKTEMTVITITVVVILSAYATTTALMLVELIQAIHEAEVKP